MNPTKKSPGAGRISRSIIHKPDRVAQLKTGMPAQSDKRPVAPPVYHPKQAPKIVQTKVGINRLGPNFQGAVQQTVPGVSQTKSSQSRQAGQASHHPVAPPVYRPEPRNIQPKMVSALPPRSRAVLGATAPAKIPNSIRPVTTKRTASTFSAVQMAEEKKAHQCSAAVVAKDGKRYEGEYENDIHAEISALEKYFKSGGDAASITKIELSSQPCKYCHIILTDLGIREKVESDDRRKYGRCSGGSYGWFARGGSVWNAIKKATGADDPDKYADTVSARRLKL